MTVPPFFDDPEDARPYFKQLRELRDSLNAVHPHTQLKELSMGMSHDFTVAGRRGFDVRADRHGTFRQAAIHMIPLNETATGVSFAVRVHPGARKSAVTGVHADALKISLSTPPVDGRANEALVAFLAETLRVPRAAVSIASGLHSRSKRVCVAGVGAEPVRTALSALL